MLYKDRRYTYRRDIVPRILRTKDTSYQRYVVPKIQGEKMLIQILAVVTEVEPARICKRINDGYIVAMASGIKFGRKLSSKTEMTLSLIK